MSDDKIKGLAKFISGNINILCEIGARKKVIEMYVEVPGDEEFMWDGSGIGKERGKLVLKG